jgi:5-methylcytosine-specific restriction endonuclease McrA
MSRKGVNNYPRESCYFCGSEGPIETHHIHPRRYGGSDEDRNLVDVCSNCHSKLEALYDDVTLKKLKNSSSVKDSSSSSTETSHATSDFNRGVFEQFDFGSDS